LGTGFRRGIYAHVVESRISCGNRQCCGEGWKPIHKDSVHLGEQKPEAVYFLDSNGKRAALLILDLEDASQIPATVEPWMLAFNASVEIHPVMIPEDLAKAGPAFEQAVKKYG
jgi:hypothetical protein